MRSRGKKYTAARQQVPNRLLGEVRGHRLVLVKLLAALEGRQVPEGDGLDDLRASWRG